MRVPELEQTMGDVELLPGWWFTTGRGRVIAVRDYHAAHLSDGEVLRRSRKPDPPPQPPRHLTWEASEQWASPTPDQRREFRPRTKEWVQRFEAWLTSRKTEKAPVPPRRGSVLVPVPKLVRATDAGPGGQAPAAAWERETHFYEVRGQAVRALAELRRVAAAAGGVQEDRLCWVAEEYAKVQRPARRSYHELLRDQAPIIEFRRASEALAAARASLDREAIARAESEMAGVRIRTASARKEARKAARGGASALGAFCLEAAERPRVQQRGVAFVAEFGPLILDFGAWCSETEYGAFVSRHPASAFDLGSPLNQLGHERFTWPEAWRTWATKSYEQCAHISPTPTVPPPLAFYVWAAYMLTALREHPDWPGCQLFLANRLASMRLVSDKSWFPWLAEHAGPHRGRRVLARLYGELLDHLALAAAVKRSASPRVIPCENCDKTFETRDGRRHYCDDCSKPTTRRRVRQRRFRKGE